MKLEEIAVFSEQMSLILNSGVDINKAFEIFYKQSENKRFNNKFKNKIKIAINELNNGVMLNEIFYNMNEFPVFYITMIKVGEESGNLSELFGILHEYYKNKSEINYKIKNAMIYPTIVCLMMTILLVAAVQFIIPNFLEVFDSAGVTLPLPTVILKNIGEFIDKYYFTIIVLIFVISTSLHFLLKDDKKKYYVHELILKVPVYKNILILETNYQYSKCFSILLNSGVDVIKSLTIIIDVVNNLKVKSSINEMILEIENGVLVSESMNKHSFFDVFLLDMVLIGEESGDLTKIFDKAAIYYNKKLYNYTIKLEKTFEITITIVMGLILGFIMFALMLPTFYLTDAI